MADSAGERTEQPTARRLNEARRDGNVTKSQDLVAACVLTGAVILIYVFFQGMFGRLQLLVLTFLSQRPSVNPTRTDDLVHITALIVETLAEVLIPLMLGVAAVALLANLLQVGFLLTGKPLQPTLSKLNPLTGAKRMVDLKSFMRLGMGLCKMGVVSGVAWLLIRQDKDIFLHMADMATGSAFALMGKLMFELALKLAVVLLILALLDYWYQKWQRLEKLKMTKQEVQEETKNMDGDPKVKQRRAQVARQLAMQRISAAVPQADVIVTNPTHFSIALKYDPETMPAPKVVAKGADFMAFRIREIAKAHGIPMVEKKPLARSLYKHTDVGQYIPPEHYAAAAEILAYVYRLSEEGAQPQQFVQA